MLTYCPANDTFLPAWRHHGFHPCFLETIGPSVLFFSIVLFGAIQLRIYRKHGTPLAAGVKPKSCAFRCQLGLLILLPLIILFRLAIQTTVLIDHKPAGYMVVYSVVYILALCVSVFLVFLERNYMLPSVPTRGHGLVILAFWALVLIFETLSFFSFNSPVWFWKMDT